MDDETVTSMMGIEGFGKQKRAKLASLPTFDDARQPSVSPDHLLSPLSARGSPSSDQY